MNNQKKNNGFTLLEVLLGVSIFAIGLLGLIALQLSAIKSAAFSGNLSEATMLASSKLELLKNLPDAHADLNDTDGDDDAGLEDVGADADHTEAGQGKNGMYTIYWNVDEDSPMTDLQTINTIVVWSAKDVQRSIQMRAIRY